MGETVNEDPRLHLVRRLGREYLAARPGLSERLLDEALADNRNAVATGAHIEFEPPEAADSESFLGSGLDVLVEAVVIAVIANFLTEISKKGLARAVKELKQAEWRRRFVELLGTLTDRARKEAIEVLDWLLANVSRVRRLLEELEDRRSAASEEDEEAG